VGEEWRRVSEVYDGGVAGDEGGGDGLEDDEVVGIVEKAFAKQLSNALGKIKSLESQLQKAQGGEVYLTQGDALNQNRHLYRKGLEKLALPDWTKMDNEGNPGLIEVILDPEKTLSENTQILYRKYRKAKRALEGLEPLISKSRKEVERWERKMEVLRVDKGKEDFKSIREELDRLIADGHATIPSRTGDILPKVSVKKKENLNKDIDSFTSPSGFPGIAGRSASANERVSFHLSKRNQVWFHVRGMPGSHVLIKADWEQVRIEDIRFAAQIAGHHSNAKGERKVEVSYCRAQQVRHPPAKFKKLGAVVVNGPESVVTVTPKLPDYTYEKS